MEWGGKLVGGLVGALLGGPVGALLGALGGHFALDLGGEGRASGRLVPARESVRGRFFRTTFEVMGHLAKSDGRVTEREIAAARALMDDFALSPESRQAAIEAYTRGKQIDYAWGSAVMALRRACIGRADLLGIFLEIQLRAAIAGSDLATPVRARLIRIAAMLGVDATTLTRLESELRAHARPAGGPTSRQPRLSLAEAYAVLGVSADVGERELERAYRRALSRHHPDKLQSRGLPESLLAHAAARTRDILEAWDVIREHRGINR